MNAERKLTTLRMDMKLIAMSVVLWATLAGALQARGAGTLTPVGSPDKPIEIRDHHVNVDINNGFARTEVIQTFFNPNAKDLEAIYAFPVPEHACLSELTIYAGEREMHGEVLSKADADRIYGEEKAKGNDAGKAEKNGYESFEFYVTPVRAQDITRLRFVYYEPLSDRHGRRPLCVSARRRRHGRGRQELLVAERSGAGHVFGGYPVELCMAAVGCARAGV